MVQNHLMQLLCLLAMEPPTSLDADAVRDEKLKVLRSLKPIAPHEVGHVTVRGQYTQGAVDGKAVPGYLADLGEGRTSRTETFVALKAEIQNWRWNNVPFYLRSGKRLPQKVSEIVVQFRGAPFNVFSSGDSASLEHQQADHPAAAGGGHEAGDDGEEIRSPGGMRLQPDTAEHQLRGRRSTRATRTPTSAC